MSGEPPHSMLGELRGFAARNGIRTLLSHAVESYLGALFRGLPGLEGYWLRSILYRSLFKSAGRGLYIYPGVRLSFCRSMRVGTRVAINSGTYIDARGGVSLGDGVMIGPNSVIVSVEHGTADTERPMWQQPLNLAPVTVGDDVWIGANVTILPGTTIGRGVVIGAGSVVAQDIPEFTVATGQPARVMRRRDAGSEFTREAVS